MPNIKGWKMVDIHTGEPVLPGVARENFRGESFNLIGASQAPEGNSTGRVAYTDPGWPHNDGRRDVYPSCFDITIVPDDPDGE